MSLRDEIRSFQDGRRAEAATARQMVALRLALGIDLPEVLAMDEARKRTVVLRLERIIERERLKGVRRHWSYDLNRHIALKQVLLRLRAFDGESAKKAPRNENGARRRR